MREENCSKGIGSGKEDRTAVAKPLLANRWYHVALTYGSGRQEKQAFVANGEMEALVQIGGLTVLIRNSDMGFVRIYGFKWGERPFHGKMSRYVFGV